MGALELVGLQRVHEVHDDTLARAEVAAGGTGARELSNEELMHHIRDVIVSVRRDPASLEEFCQFGVYLFDEPVDRVCVTIAYA